MARPSPAALALMRSSLPARRVSTQLSTPASSRFASLLQSASTAQTPAQAQTSTQTRLTRAALPGSASLSGLSGLSMAPISGLSTAAVSPRNPVEFTTPPGSGPAPTSRSQILANASQLMGIPYVWGGNSSQGLDCSAFVSKAWGISRHTTDTLASVARPISKEELQPGDALNLTTGADAEGYGHVRLFDRWANAEHTQMWVYEETPPRSIHHVINWDPKYQPMRRLNTLDS